MVKRTMPKAEYVEIAPAYKRDGKQHYYLRVNPVENDESVTFIEDVIDHEPTDDDKLALVERYLHIAKMAMIAVVRQHDLSPEVNYFLFNGKRAWFDKATRVGLCNSISIEKAAGKKDTRLFVNGEEWEVEVDTALSLMQQIELYAIGVYRQTEAHKAAINALADINAVENYDYTKGYPEPVEFSIS